MEPVAALCDESNDDEDGGGLGGSDPDGHEPNGLEDFDSSRVHGRMRAIGQGQANESSTFTSGTEANDRRVLKHNGSSTSLSFASKSLVEQGAGMWVMGVRQRIIVQLIHARL